MAKKKPNPKTWTEPKKKAAIEDILSKLANGQSLRSVLDTTRDKDLLPSRRVFNEWLLNDEKLRTQYASACEARQDKIFEDILKIADDASQDVIKNDNGGESINQEFAARSRIKIDARKWMLGKMNPKKYGERIQQDVTVHTEQQLYPDPAADEKE